MCKYNKKGFTLLECLFAILLVGIAVAALVAANGSLTRVNAAGVELSTAEFLIEQIKELTDLVAVVDPEGGTFFGPEEAALANYDDVDDFDGFNSDSLGGPITADRQILSDFAAYTQTVTVQNISESNFEQVVPNHTSYFVRITASVILNGRELSSASWIRANY